LAREKFYRNLPARLRGYTLTDANIRKLDRLVPRPSSEAVEAALEDYRQHRSGLEYPWRKRTN
jgi:hypothetical protein